jgi:5-methylcytosine-specific restriction endonuclease McrA
MTEKFLIANITWNPTGWRNTYINPKAGHKYAKEHPGHESLNFKFDKKGIDTATEIYGFIQWTAKPKQFKNGGTIIFYTTNTDEHKGQIVGIYSNAEILESRIKLNWKGFQDDTLDLNIKAEKDLSLLFPIPLDANNYKENETSKLTGQVGYSYHDISLAEQIITDELIELSKSGTQKNEFEKLKRIYFSITGKEFDTDILDSDELEQLEIIEIYKTEQNKSKIIDDLRSLKESEPEVVIINQKTFKRDNKTIAQLKMLRNFECQLCGAKILKKNNDYYIEAAHIKSKSLKGRETPDNILILCPNHHKEFDYGNRIINQHSTDKIVFELNGTNYEIDLRIEQ